jgi:hypothetical protein
LTNAIEIQHDLTKESSKYVRHAVRHVSPPSVGVNGTTTTSTGIGTGTAGPEEEQKNKIAAGHAELEKLANERVALAMRIVSLMTRTRTRLDGDLVRIGILQGEVDKGSTAAVVLGGAITPTGSAIGEDVYVMHGRNTAVAISESLRHALSGGAGAGGGGGGEPLPKSWVFLRCCMEGSFADVDRQSDELGVLLLRRSSCRAVDMHDRDCRDRSTLLRRKERLMQREKRTRKEKRWTKGRERKGMTSRSTASVES